MRLISLTTGEFVGLLDHDDETIDPTHYLEKFSIKSEG